MRKIEYDLPRKVVELSSERFLDEETGHMIAVDKVELYGKIREVMVAYVIEGRCVTLLTVHPLKKGQKDNRVETSRWRKIK